MWTFNDASNVGASDMDRRTCPSYEAGFDACDPLGSVLEWSGRGPARVLRRRCRSEGVDRSPYEHVPTQRSTDGIRISSNNKVPYKSHFTINSALETRVDKYRKECSLPIAQKGDYIMAHNHRTYNSHQPARQKSPKRTLNRPLLVRTLSNTNIEDNHLPKVEELFEKIDHDIMEVPVTKQPLKSILNNPLPKSPPQGILKKPKTRSFQDPYTSPDRRRRQRASSESDNLYNNYHISSPNTGYDRLPSNLKRAKDNSGTGYSYGSAIATVGFPQSKSAVSSARRTASKPHSAHPSPEDYHARVHVLRTTAITNEPLDVDPLIEFVCSQPLQNGAIPKSPTATDHTANPLVGPPPAAKKQTKTVKKKQKPGSPRPGQRTVKMKAIVESAGADTEESPSVDKIDFWKMDTDAVMMEIEKIEAQFPPKPPPSPIVMEKTEIQLPPAVQPVFKTPVKSLVKEKVEIAEPPTSVQAIVKSPSKPPALPPAIPPTAPVKKTISSGSPINMPEAVANCLRPSLFPKVPPYVRFINHDETPCLKIPLPIQKHLKWKLTSITPIVVKKTLTNSGFRLVKSECDTSECPQEETVEWVGIWGKHMKSLLFRGLKDGQKMNHFPGTFQIGRKDRLWRNLQKLTTKHGMKEFGIMPKTYVLPHDLKLLKMDWDKHNENNERWIIKPPASARGTGIKVVSRWTQIPKKRSVVVQRYVSKPYLINGSKFDMRLYVLVTSVHPLRIYLYKDGLARFASVKYTEEITSLNDRYMHLTNYSINKLSKNYTPNEDFAACEGHKWTLQTLFQYLKKERRVDTKALWDSLKDLVIKTIIAGEASISSLTKANVSSRYICYELFGIDVLLDEDLKPWLLEVNISPSLHSASPLDIHVKGPLVTETLNIAQYQLPNRINLDMLTKDKPHKLGGLPYDSRLYTIYLSKEERDKHIIYTNMEDRDLYLRDILSTLTPDDVRHLIQAEDELTQAGDMERVFPTWNTYKYLDYLCGPRYYNRLFDAWESRYTANRQSGIDLLRNLCEIGYHLEVPPVPLKNDVDAPSPPASEQPSMHSFPSPDPTATPSSSSVSAPQTCGDVLAQPPLLPTVEPRA